MKAMAVSFQPAAENEKNPSCYLNPILKVFARQFVLTHAHTHKGSNKKRKIWINVVESSCSLSFKKKLYYETVTVREFA